MLIVSKSRLILLEAKLFLCCDGVAIRPTAHNLDLVDCLNKFHFIALCLLPLLSIYVESLMEVKPETDLNVCLSPTDIHVRAESLLVPCLV